MKKSISYDFEEKNKTGLSGYLRLENISKSYFDGQKQRVVLKETCFQFKKGEFAAILGKSGSGKTTLLNLISGIDRSDFGSVFLDGINLSLLSENARTLIRREKIGFIFQFFNLIPTLSVWENVTLPLELNNKMDAVGAQKADELLFAVGLHDRKDGYPDQLSGGEQQRVSIARALVHDPAIVLADEPTGNLDEETGFEVLHMLNSLVRDNGKNLILVTHSPTAASFADRILVLKDGQLLEDHQKKSFDL